MKHQTDCRWWVKRLLLDKSHTAFAGKISQNVLKALFVRRRASLLALGTEAPLLLGLFFLQSMKDAFAEQRQARFTIPLSFDQFQLGHLSFDHAVIDPPG